MQVFPPRIILSTGGGKTCVFCPRFILLTGGRIGYLGIIIIKIYIYLNGEVLQSIEWGNICVRNVKCGVCRENGSNCVTVTLKA